MVWSNTRRPITWNSPLSFLYESAGRSGFPPLLKNSLSALTQFFNRNLSQGIAAGNVDTNENWAGTDDSFTDRVPDNQACRQKMRNFWNYIAQASSITRHLRNDYHLRRTLFRMRTALWAMSFYNFSPTKKCLPQMPRGCINCTHTQSADYDRPVLAIFLPEPRASPGPCPGLLAVDPCQSALCCGCGWWDDGKRLFSPRL
jgi:hypothetical protein